jgi:hypothetical protein
MDAGDRIELFVLGVVAAGALMYWYKNVKHGRPPHSQLSWQRDKDLMMRCFLGDKGACLKFRQTVDADFPLIGIHHPKNLKAF